MKRVTLLLVMLVGFVPYSWSGDLGDQEMDAFLKEKQETQSQFEREKSGKKEKNSDMEVKSSENMFKPVLMMDKNIPPVLPEAVLPDPVGEYLFNGNANDTSSYGNHGQINGAQLTEDRFNQAESAYIFYERDHRLKIPRSDANTFSDGSFTVSFWVKTKDGNNNMKGLVTNEGSLVNRWGFFLNSDGQLIFSIKNQEGQNAFINTPINDWTWHQVTGVRNAEENTMSLYVDGNLIQTRAGVAGSVDSGESIWVGDGKNLMFVGRLDDITLWNRALDNRQLAKLHERGPLKPVLGTQSMTAMLPGIPDPVARYMFDGNAEDTSGNGNHAVVTGAELVEDRAGNPDSAYLFYARLHQIKIPKSDKNTFANGSFTASFWVKPNEKPISMVHLLTNEASSNPKWGFMYSQDGALVFLLTNQEKDHAMISTPMTVGTWHHVMGCRNAQNNTMRLFLDGTLVETRPAVTGNVDSLGPIHAGDHKNLLFKGRMDEILLWDRALPEAKMSEFYQQTSQLAQTVSYSPDDDNSEEPVGLYHFDGDAVDASPQHNDAQVNEAQLTQDRFGNANKAYSFYGRDNRIKVPLIPANTFSKGSFTVSLWVKVNETMSGNMVGLVTNDASPNQKWGVFYASNSGLVFLIRDKEGHLATLIHPVDVGTWHHVVGVRDASAKNIRLYVDKHLIGTKPFSGSDVDSGGAIWIGDGKNLIFRGCIDEVILWRRALSHQEITAVNIIDPHPTTAVPLDNTVIIKEKPLNLNHKLPKR